MKFLPTKYVKDIYHISYSKLKQEGIHYLIFDLDNTIRHLEEKIPIKKTKEFIENLKKDFTVIIISNNYKHEVEPYAKELDVTFFFLSLKPSRRAFRKIMRQFNCKKEEMVMIGDQLVTDIFAGNRISISTILVDPLSKKDMKVTSLNRKIENHIFKKYQALGILERGKYYE